MAATVRRKAWLSFGNARQLKATSVEFNLLRVVTRTMPP